MPRTAIADLAGNIVVLDPPVDAGGNVRLPEGAGYQVVTLTVEQEAAIQAAADAVVATIQAEVTARTALRDLAQSTVGVALNDLTTPQLKAVLGILVRRAGGLANDLTIRPLADWMR